MLIPKMISNPVNLLIPKIFHELEIAFFECSMKLFKIKLISIL